MARFGKPINASPLCLAVQPSNAGGPLLGHVPLPMASKLQASVFQTGSNVALLTMLLGKALALRHREFCCQASHADH